MVKMDLMLQTDEAKAVQEKAAKEAEEQEAEDDAFRQEMDGQEAEDDEDDEGAGEALDVLEEEGLILAAADARSTAAASVLPTSIATEDAPVVAAVAAASPPWGSTHIRPSSAHTSRSP